MTQPPDESERQIVVGVDGSPSSNAALAWAVKQARSTGAVVMAVTAWEFGLTYEFPPSAAFDVDYAQMAADVLADAIAKVSSPGVQVKIRSMVAAGHPAQVLLDASQRAELLVVGNRGRGGFAAALLGSVSQHCVQHATCPVVVIRDSDSSS